MKKRLKKISIMIVSIVVLLLSGLYCIPPAEEVIQYPLRQQENREELQEKVGWYQSLSDTDHYFQLTFGANHDLTLNYFDSLRSNLKSYKLTAINENQFDTNGDRGTVEVEFFKEPDTKEIQLVLNTSKTNLVLQKVDRLHYKQREVFYANKEVQLAGLLLEPYAKSKSTLIVIIHGSGFSDRDSFWYMYQADYLAKRGFSVLLPDKRGCGKSRGEWHKASFDDFSEDILAGVSYLKNDPGNKFNKIGVMGLSQGGWISHLVANKSEDIDFVVDVVSSLRAPKKQLNYEVKKDMNMGFLGGIFSPIFARRAKKKRKVWWKKNGDFDPKTHIVNAHTPTLKILAQHDENINTKKNLKLADDFLKVHPDLDFEVVLFKDLGHSLIATDTGWIKNEYLDTIISWVTKI